MTKTFGAYRDQSFSHETFGNRKRGSYLFCEFVTIKIQYWDQKCDISDEF